MQKGRYQSQINQKFATVFHTDIALKPKVLSSEEWIDILCIENSLFRRPILSQILIATFWDIENPTTNCMIAKSRASEVDVYSDQG